jgi:hypothetical protein
VYETKLKLPRRLLSPEQMQLSRTPAARELMHQIQHHMLNSWRMPQRRPYGAVGYLESDFLCERLRKRLPKLYLSRPIAKVQGLSPSVVKNLGDKSTVGDVLALDLHRLRVRSRASLEEAIRTRRILLGFGERVATGKKVEPSEPVKSATTHDTAQKVVSKGTAAIGKRTKRASSRNKTKAAKKNKGKRK